MADGAATPTTQAPPIGQTSPRPGGRGRGAPRVPAAASGSGTIEGGAFVPTGALPGWMYRLSKYRGAIVPVAFVLMLGVLIVPVSPVLMDILICLNIALGMVILLTTVYMKHPLDFSVFPSLLLATTLFRLVLNVASTRLILTADASSAEEAASVAGHVIMAFGQFVAGDDLFVGIVIFAILVIVQFMVITKGATRISEVAARFTLDAMPGKQMAIDSDLSAGLIDEGEARKRRERVSQEADFFGAMDGASKFVRGDAIAGIIITLINVAGGFAVGIIARGWDAKQTAEVFTRLTIGDGLTSQIPSFVIAIASALIVTRSGSKQELGDQVTGQMVSQPKGLMFTAGFLALLALTPLPATPLLTTAGVLGLIAWGMSRERSARARMPDATVPGAGGAGAAGAPQEEAPVESLLKVDTLELEVGYALVALVDKGQGGDVLDRISAIRRQLAVEVGLVMPPVRIRDNMQLPSTEYRIKVRGNAVAGGMLRPNKMLAMDAGMTSGAIEGEATREPAFGLPAWWISRDLRPRAEMLNYTVVEASSVLGTHLTEVVKAHADELLTRDEVQNLLEQLKQRAPRIVEDTVPAILKPVELQKILQNLLRERVPIRDLETILETIAEWGSKTKDLDVLTEYVRNALRRTICQLVASVDAATGTQRLSCVTLDPTLEDYILAHVDRGPAGTTLTMPSKAAQAVGRQVAGGLSVLTSRGSPAVVVASPPARAVVRQLVEPHVPGVVVLGYNEIVQGVEVESVALVSPPEGVLAGMQGGMQVGAAGSAA